MISANQRRVKVGVLTPHAAAGPERACGAHRLVLVHPPWFDDEIDRMGVGLLPRPRLRRHSAKGDRPVARPELNSY